MSKQTSSKPQTALQRWQASGLAKPSPLKERLAMLCQLAKLKLNGTELALCTHLILERINAETGLCFATDQTIADNLGVTLRIIKKTKASLKAKGILDWNTENLNRKNSVSLYRFYYKVRGNERSPSINTNVPHPMVNERSPSIGNERSPSTENKTETYYAKWGDPALDAWDAYKRQTTGKSLPRDKRGGWLLPQQWPPTQDAPIVKTSTKFTH